MTTPVQEPLLQGLDLLEEWLAHRESCIAAGQDSPVLGQAAG